MLNLIQTRVATACDHRTPLLLPLTYAVVMLSISGCKQPGPTPPEVHSISPATGAYATAQTVDVFIPEDATDAYVTTDSREPIPAESCALATGHTRITVTRPTAIKIRYNQHTQTITDAAYYFIEDQARDGGYFNRNVLLAWEALYVKDILHLFTVPNQDYSLLTHDDGQGGSVTLETNITERGGLWNDPEAGNQAYTFQSFHARDREGKPLLLQSGRIYGARTEARGYYNSEIDGAPIVFSGAYNGTAEGNFQMDGQGRTTSGYYRITCSDVGCAPGEVVYGLNRTATSYIEIDPTPDENTISCNPTVVD